MTTTDKVFVTGISGYIGRHCAAELLRSGYRVRGSLRDLSKSTAISTAISEELGDPVDIEFCKLDLLKDDGWDDAMQGCNFALHIASPIYMKEPLDPDDLLKPAVDGTRRALEAARRAQVKRVVLTSSSLAMTGDMDKVCINGKSWTDESSEKINTYTKSKTLAEKEAWNFVKDQESREIFELVTINPGPVYGPPIGVGIEGESMTFFSKIMNGEMPMLPKTRAIVSDVRDVARVHVLAMTAKGAAGQRLIPSTPEAHSFLELARLLKSHGYAKVKTRVAPTALLRVIALFDREVKGILPLVGKDITADIEQTKNLLGWTPIDYEKTVLDTAASLLGKYTNND